MFRTKCLASMVDSTFTQMASTTHRNSLQGLGPRIVSNVAYTVLREWRW